MHTEERIQISLEIREKVKEVFQEVFANSFGLSEKDLALKIYHSLEKFEDLNADGWYSPPLYGIAILIGNPGSFHRLNFDSLRLDKYWPSDEILLTEESIVIAYASPIHRSYPLIGDYGTTIYFGSDQKIISHMKNVRESMDQAVVKFEQGMKFSELHRIAQEEFRLAELNNDLTKTVTDTVGTNLGHTFPFTFDSEPFPDGYDKLNQEEVKNLISQRRIYLNREEKFIIPGNIVFSFEARLESNDDSSLPICFYHDVLSFINGEKEVKKDENSL